MEFPLIYCNGDSYSDENLFESLKGNTYVDVVAKHYNGFVINKAVKGSCNRRIIRTTVHDILHQRQLNPTQPILVLLGLSFEIRSELWVETVKDNSWAEESNFKTHAFTGMSNWREKLLKNLSLNPRNDHKLNNKFFEKFSQGRAYFYNPYAERINLFTDLIMLRALLESLKINFLIFQAVQAEKLESEYLLDYFKQQLDGDDRFIDFELFGFANWCAGQGFKTFEDGALTAPGHFKPDAHRAFAEQILLPRLADL